MNQKTVVYSQKVSSNKNASSSATLKAKRKISRSKDFDNAPLDLSSTLERIYDDDKTKSINAEQSQNGL